MMREVNMVVKSVKVLEGNLKLDVLRTVATMLSKKLFYTFQYRHHI